MGADTSAIAERKELYRRFWKRKIAGTYHSSPSEVPQIDVYAFRPTWKPWAPVSTYFVYITGGVSDQPMPAVRPGSDFSRLELSCYALAAPGIGNPQKDVIAKWLHTFARLPFDGDLRIKPGDTFDVGQPLAPDSEMTGFYFGTTPFVDRDALCRATLNAQAVAHLIPISKAERRLAEKEGPAALVEEFDKVLVAPVFDLDRKSCV